jgi:1-pyrroline-5-carboxylate dehydrogenase
MSAEKKITYVSLETDESIHAEFEQALNRAEGELGESHPMMIGGSEVNARETFEVRSPIDTSLLIGTFQQGDKQDAKKGILAAREAFLPWSQLDWKERVNILRRSADLLERQRFLLAALITLEVGKTRGESIAEVGESIDMIRYHCQVYEEQEGFIQPLESQEATVRSVLKPYGVWAVISPFNFPLDLAASMASAALLTGNTVIFKPTSIAPLAGISLYRAFQDGGVQEGAINLITGPGEPFGNMVTGSRQIDGIAFTGSRRVGTWLQRAFLEKQPYPKPIISEMGSKNPAIVGKSANLEHAVEGIVRGAFGYGGQKCSATSRVYVQQSRMAEFSDALIARTQELNVGDPRERDVFYGPLISAQALQTFKDTVAHCTIDGGRILTGGRALDQGRYKHGFYAEPTIATDLAIDHPLVQTELFVPFLILDTYTTLVEALEKANATEYGLTAGIFSTDPDEIKQFFAGIRFGVCYANRKGGATTGAWPGSQSFGGWKASGSTGKGLGGPYYLLSYMREQSQTLYE